MGRIEKSQGLAPPSIRRDIRAKQARQIINKAVPAILASNGRARRGAEGSELIVDPRPVGTIETGSGETRVRAVEDATYTTRKGQGRRKVKSHGEPDDEIIVREGHSNSGTSKRKSKARTDSLDATPPVVNTIPFSPTSPKKNRTIHIIATDTLTAAHMLTFPSHYPNSATSPSKPSGKPRNVCILNMASPLRPGGGVLSGATSQEEFLCARTTLLPSLKENFYRLPELGGIWTSDVLVFRSALPLGDSRGELGMGERYWVDVVSAGMLRFPELEGEEEEVKRLGKKDRELVEAKMRAVLRIAVGKGARRVVLGAWGCGAYGNPVGDVAAAWRRVLDGEAPGGGRKGKSRKGDVETWEGLEDVVFAITNRKMANNFAKAFGGDVEVEAGPGDVDEDEDDEDDSVAEELRSKIQEMESQVDKVWNPELKVRMSVILEGLRTQLQEREGGDEDVKAQSDDGVLDEQIGRASEEHRVRENSDEEQDLEEGGVVLEGEELVENSSRHGYLTVQ